MQVSKLHTDHINTHQRLVLNMILLLTCAAGMLFFLLNIQSGLIELAIAELVMSLVSFWLYFRLKTVHHYQRFQRIALMYLSFLYSIMIFAMWQKSASITVFVWIFLMPVLSYLLLGRRWGLWITSVFTTSAFIVVCINFNDRTTLMHYIALLNIVLCLTTIWFIAHAYESATVAEKDKLALMSLQDTLTGLYNRNALSVFLEQHDASKALSMIILDIDWFKTVNDTYGHDVGDKSLQIVSRELQESFPEGDVLRLGGEEFCVLLPEVSLAQGALSARQFLCHRQQHPVQVAQATFTLTLSAGIAEYPKESASFEELHKLADKRLYQAKNTGRNQLISE